MVKKLNECVLRFDDSIIILCGKNRMLYSRVIRGALYADNPALSGPLAIRLA